MKIINSPNFDQRPGGIKLDTIVIHHTKMSDHISALKRLCDPEAKVSAHYLISKQGEIYSLVGEEFRAWHAGVSFWRGKEKINDNSIGIELDNTGEEEFSDELMDALVSLLKPMIEKYNITPPNIIGHSDIAPGRKDDPGRFFNWQFLASKGIGIFPKEVEVNEIPSIKVIQGMLAQYGYNITMTGEMDKQTLDVMKAFNEHFNQACKENWDKKSQGMLEALIVEL